VRSICYTYFKKTALSPPASRRLTYTWTRRAASTFTPWFRLIAESFLYKWWDALLASRPQDGSGALLDAKALVAEVEKDKEAMGQIIRMW
jgi:hypothetical protein